MAYSHTVRLTTPYSAACEYRALDKGCQRVWPTDSADVSWQTTKASARQSIVIGMGYFYDLEPIDSDEVARIAGVHR